MNNFVESQAAKIFYAKIFILKFLSLKFPYSKIPDAQHSIARKCTHTFCKLVSSDMYSTLLGIGKSTLTKSSEKMVCLI